MAEHHQHHNLRCDEANVKVIVGDEQQQEEEETDDDDEGNKKGDGSINNKETTTTTTTTKKQVFWHYSHILACHSRYVDALLSAPLAAASTSALAASTINKDTTKKSRKSKDANNNNNNADDFNDEDDTNITITEISFPDISPSNWERMYNFITDPVASRKMSVEDAMELVGMYDKYDFHTGIKLCDEILSSVFIQGETREEFQNRTMKNMKLFDRCVQVVVLSHEKNLTQTLSEGMLWMTKIFWSRCDPECVILTADHLRKLVPVIACHDDRDKDWFSVQEAIGLRLSNLSIDILNPMFPEFFVSQIQLIVARNTTLKLVNQIKVSTNRDHDEVMGMYDAMDDNHKIDRSSYYVKSNEQSDINLTRNEVDDWIIEDDDVNVLLFICEGSRCEILPPRTGWKRIAGANNVGQTNLPVLSYYHNDGTKRREVVISRMSI